MRRIRIRPIPALLALALAATGIGIGARHHFGAERESGGTRRVVTLGEGDFHLRDVAERAGVTLHNVCGPESEKQFIIQANGSGAALFDYDGDGDLDIYVVNGSTIPILRGQEDPVRNALYRNDGDWKFTDVTAEAGVGDTGWGFGCAVGDIDGDGNPDLYVTNFGRNVLLENRGDGTFREVGKAAGLADEGWGESAAFGDIDNDGDLDLYLVNHIVYDIDHPPRGGRPCEFGRLKVYCGPNSLAPQEDRLYRNDGAGRFEDVSVPSGIHDPAPQYGLGVVLGDYDDDGWVDIYVANDSVPNFLFRNLGEGRFEEVASLAGAARSHEGTAQAGMGVDFGDFDSDGRTDIVVTNFSDDHNTLYRATGDGLFEDLSYAYGVGQKTWHQLAWGTKFFDADNDADLDLYIANGHVYPEVDGADLGTTYGQGDQLFLNSGQGKFVDASDRIRIHRPPQSSRGAAFGDLDGDGDIDVLVVEMSSPPTLLENVGGSRNNWIRFSLRGRRSSREGIGARVWVTAAGATQRREITRSGSYCSSHDPRAHFGLGDADRVEEVEVRWPSGKVQRFSGLAANRDLLIDEETGIVPGD